MRPTESAISTNATPPKQVNRFVHPCKSDATNPSLRFPRLLRRRIPHTPVLLRLHGRQTQQVHWTCRSSVRACSRVQAQTRRAGRLIGEHAHGTRRSRTQVRTRQVGRVRRACSQTRPSFQHHYWGIGRQPTGPVYVTSKLTRQSDGHLRISFCDVSHLDAELTDKQAPSPCHRKLTPSAGGGKAREARRCGRPLELSCRTPASEQELWLLLFQACCSFLTAS